MNITNQDTANTFVFSEKDLPGFSSKLKGQQSGGLPPSRVPRSMYQDRAKKVPQEADKPRRWQPYFRTAIPSRCMLKDSTEVVINAA